MPNENNLTSTAQPQSILRREGQENAERQANSTRIGKRIRENRNKNSTDTTASGLNKFTTKFIEITKQADKAAGEIINGKPLNPDEQRKFQFSKPQDYGIIPILELISSIDLCNVINYLIDQIPGDKNKFNPNDPENEIQQKSVAGRAKYRIQFAAFKIQGYIDGYYSTIDDIKNSGDPENVSKVKNILIKIVETVNELNQTTDSVFNDPFLNEAFPQLSNYTNFLSTVTTIFNRYTDLRSIPSANEFNKILKYIDKTRTTCILIQGLNKPRDLIAFVDTFTGGKIGKEIQRLQKLIDPKKIENVIKNIQSAVNKAYSAIRLVMSSVNTVRSLIGIVNLIVKILTFVVNFLKKLPIPGIFSTVGVNNTISDITQFLNNTIKFLLDRLKEINRILSAIYWFCQRRLTEFDQILNLLQIIRINLQNCNIQPETKDNIEQAISQSTNISNTLSNYIKTYDNNSKKRKNRIGEYTIQILTEEVVDEGISIRRRYGVALNPFGIVVAKSTPTFATNDSVIIEEVKLLLPKKKSLSLLTQQDLDIMNEVSNYLETDEPIDQSIEIIDEPEDIEDTDSEDDDPPEGLGLQGFVNRLKGGKRLRRRMRREMAKSKRNLANQINSTNPQSPLSKSTEIKALKAELDVMKDDLNAKKKRLTVLSALAITNPAIRLVIIKLVKEIKDLEKQIEEKQKKINELEKTNVNTP